MGKRFGIRHTIWKLVWAGFGVKHVCANMLRRLLLASLGRQNYGTLCISPDF